MSEWKEYTGSDEQLIEMRNAVNGHIFRDNLELESSSVLYYREHEYVPKTITHYLICDRHPYADMIKRWADTGQPVYWRNMIGGASGECRVNSNKECHKCYFSPFLWPYEYEYSFTPFE
jgi:hypothetical protein